VDGDLCMDESLFTDSAVSGRTDPDDGAVERLGSAARRRVSGWPDTPWRERQGSKTARERRMCRAADAPQATSAGLLGNIEFPSGVPPTAGRGRSHGWVRLPSGGGGRGEDGGGRTLAGEDVRGRSGTQATAGRQSVYARWTRTSSPDGVRRQGLGEYDRDLEIAPTHNKISPTEKTSFH